MGPLDGLKVLDLSPTQVGARVSQVLADFGADVVWVEPPGGALLRQAPSFPYFARGKRSVELDLREPGGRDAVLSMADAADVLIETFRPGTAERLGLGYEALAARNPALVYTSITGWGREGPLADVPGYEGLVHAKLGVMQEFRRMHPDKRPAYLSVPFASYGAAMTALHGVLAALVERDGSGRGQRVEANLAQGFAILDTWQWFVRLINQRFPEAYSGGEAFDEDGIPASPLLYMLLLPLTSDGRWLQFAQVAPHLFAALMKHLGLDWMFADPDWKGLPAFEDQERRRRLWAMMLEAAGSRSVAEWEAVFDADPNVFAEQFRNGHEVLDHPQLVADGQSVTNDDGVRMPAALVNMLGTPADVTRPAPRLGATRPEEVAWQATAAGAGDGPGRTLPLDGVTVLELTQLFAAPFGATVLTDLGARVFKVEPLSGDPIRNMTGFPETAGAKVMQGKESLTVDLQSEEGVEIVRRLAARSDIVLESFRAGVADRLGVGYDALREVNPDLVHLHAAGYGEGPPDGNRPAFAPSIAAAAGMARANAGPGVPERPGIDMETIQDGARRLSAAGTATNANADGVSALGVATGMLLGLVAKRRGAGGQRITSSMLATCSHAMADHTVDNPKTGPTAHADEDLRGLHARYRLYDAADGWVFLAAPQEHEWPSLVAALADHVDLDGDERFATEGSRRTNDDALIDVLGSVFAKGGKDDWERDLLRAGVGCVAVTTDPIEDVLWGDEIGVPSGWVTEVEHPTFDRHPRLTAPVRFSRSATQAKPAQLAGQSNDAVLAELGYTTDQIADLRARGIVG